MESKSKENNTPKGPGTVESLMLWFGIWSIFSGLIWTLTGLGDEKTDIWAWFSRFALGLVCLGFYGVIREIRKNREKDEIPD